MSIDLTLIQNLLDTHYGIGADKRMLLAHIDAYERLVPGLIVEVERLNAELSTVKCEPVVEWRQIRHFDRATCGCFTLEVFTDGWKLDFRPRPESPPHRIASGDKTGDAGKAACIAAYMRTIGA